MRIHTPLLFLALATACGNQGSSSTEDTSAILAFEAEFEEAAETKKIKFINSSDHNVTVKYKKNGETVEAIVRANSMAPTETYDGGDIEFSPSDQVEAKDETKDGVRTITFKNKSGEEAPFEEEATIGG